ncbi:MAG: ATP-binding protein [Clostridiales bacterium]|uniref:hybrid sensor histidine kinase/response regulator n=1 Tax=Faecalicatena sp. TaxID=2005360 RepID=UPI0025844D72|nr:ATP-binding protein [Faecalicatena sp.]MCI6040441.1 ATP-binding protein [Clostridiales bacterium]MCI6465488.1 ATP-binding protein [Faecalicatena sp.]MDY5617320.1 ATP-binding protein [Lachnospiraceae bacterium]
MRERTELEAAALAAELGMYREIADEAADTLCVVEQKSHEILYFHEAKKLIPHTDGCVGKKCYEVFHGRVTPCPFCTLRDGVAGEDREVESPWNQRLYRIHSRATNWNGKPAFIQLLRDVTEEEAERQKKKRLEEYFQTLADSLPGGVSVVRRQKDWTITPEYLSSGFADMTHTSLDQAWETYRQDALGGVHPDDVERIKAELEEAFANIDRHYELTYRLLDGTGGYIWVSNTLTMLPDEDGGLRQYCYIRDITKEREEQERTRAQYKKLILQHYQEPGANTLVLGHCNITQNKILEINDFTSSGSMKSLGMDRESFFTAISQMIVDAGERQKFLDRYLSAPLLESYRRKELEQSFTCLTQFPGERVGRYVQYKVNLVEDPDSGDLTGILSVTDITEQIVANLVPQRLSDIGYDHILVLDIPSDRFTVFAGDWYAARVPSSQGDDYTQWKDHLLENCILPKDRDAYRKHLNTDYIIGHLKENGSYSFDYSMVDEDENIKVKRMTVFAIDLRLGRVGLSQMDVTETVREQQSLLNMLAYTFEIASFIDISTKRMVMHTRETVLEALSPLTFEDCDSRIQAGLSPYHTTGQNMDEVRQQFLLDTILEQLKEHPLGYDFVCAYQGEDSLQYKKINILWGDRNHRTVCIVRADVTEMLAEERKNKQKLEDALSLAKQASQAKTDFFSTMSHDIRTPMNAIMGMTELALSRPENPDYVKECLGKISLSSKHLLNLINDVLDMSKIEHRDMELNRECLSLNELVEQVCTMVRPQALEKHQQFHVKIGTISHEYFYGDGLRINQILINILGNAVKFTTEGGQVDFLVDELPAVNGAHYQFVIRDTGMGMSPEFLARVFEPFARGMRVSRVQGTGLGLSITKGLVERMGGTIFAESQEGKGSLFQIDLEFEAETEAPAGTNEKEQPNIPEKAADILAGRYFLVAEDNEINAEILQSLLEIHGAGSQLETDGKKAVEAFWANPPGTYDAVLMDIQMPVMNGYEATRAIRALTREDAGTIPIIAMTANAFAEDVQTALDAGMTAHVAKPIDLDVLKTTLKNALL